MIDEAELLSLLANPGIVPGGANRIPERHREA
jgi:hypothetical protein